nr:hypothetical protein [uncultured Enterobacter sp.]
MTTGYVTQNAKRLVSFSPVPVLTRQGNIQQIIIPNVVNGVSHSRFQPNPLHVRSGYIPENWLDQFYNRIVAIPESIALGAVYTDQVLTIQIWNAYLTTQMLEHITITGSEGISISGLSAPLKFNRLTVNSWTVTVSTDGPAEIDCNISFAFADLPVVSCRITGARSVAWLCGPTWDDGITETLEWKTDVLLSQTGASQRVARRLTPRRTYEFKIAVEGQERRLLEQQLFAFGASEWALPVYPDVAILSDGLKAGDLTIEIDASGRDFVVGGTILIAESCSITARNETLIIKAVNKDSLELLRPLQSSWPVGSYLWPLRSARLTEQPELKRLSDGVMTAQIRFQLTESSNGPETTRMALYRNFPVMEINADWSEDLTAKYTRLISELDNDIGIPYWLDSASRPFPVQLHRWSVWSRVEQTALRAIFYWLNGRQRPVWLPSQCSDLIAIDDIVGPILYVEYAGISIKGPQSGRRDLKIETYSGNYFARITNCERVNGNVERLLLDNSLSVNREEIIKISWLTLCHSYNDSVSWQHQTDADGLAIIEHEFEGVRDELE